MITDEELDEIARQYKREPMTDAGLNRVHFLNIVQMVNVKEVHKRDAINLIYGIALGLIVGIVLGAKLFS